MKTWCKWMYGAVGFLWIGCAEMPEPKEAEKSKPANDWKLAYSNDFEGVEPGQEPSDAFVLDGTYRVETVGQGKELVLAGEPLGDFGVLFGPRVGEAVAIKVRVRGDTQGRRMPAFSVGVGGRSGLKMRLAPMARRVEFRLADEVVASGSHKWNKNEWVWLELILSPGQDGEWTYDGRVWGESSERPADPMVTWATKEEPTKGKPSIWGFAFSEQPIHFDDLEIRRIEKESDE